MRSFILGIATLVTFGSAAAFTQTPAPAQTVAAASVKRARVPFSVGEKMEYDVKFGVLRVGNAHMRDLREVDVDILTLGQYLRPSDAHIPLDRYYTPQEFKELYQIGMEMGFRHVESGPLVRSSYHAWEQVQAAGV